MTMVPAIPAATWARKTGGCQNSMRTLRYALPTAVRAPSIRWETFTTTNWLTIANWVSLPARPWSRCLTLRLARSFTSCLFPIGPAWRTTFETPAKAQTVKAKTMNRLKLRVGLLIWHWLPGHGAPDRQSFCHSLLRGDDSDEAANSAQVSADRPQLLSVSIHGECSAISLRRSIDGRLLCSGFSHPP